MMPPRAAYRLQFRDGMDFDRAVATVPYLKSLGISHLYASPIFKATGGSTHGYDVVDHNAIDPVLGGREGFECLSTTLKQAGLGLILDIVPNHMAASLENDWWRDVVEWGEQSAFRNHFDIDWRERLTLPVLGRPYEEALAANELSVRLDRHRSGLALVYFDNSLPLHPRSYSGILSRVDDPLAAEIVQHASMATPGSAAIMHRRITALLSEKKPKPRLEKMLAQLSANPEFIDHVHDAQPWRLVFWKDAKKHLSYRRFFEVTGLVGVRVEDDKVFDDVHRLILELVRSGRVDGLRLDHVDGLAEPKAYLDRLRQEVGPDVYLVVEKILVGDEKLPTDWPVQGTTGYEFIASMANVFVDSEKAADLDRVYAHCTGEAVDVEAQRRAARRLMVGDNFETELTALTNLASELAASIGEPLPPDLVAQAIGELIVAFPIYRTYGTGSGMPERDRDLLSAVAKKVRATGENVDEAALDFVLQLLTGEFAEGVAAGASDFRKRFQQLTGPVMAKSVEDTLFYRYNRLIALNEVGGEPVTAGSLTNFHANMADQRRLHPDGLLATSTHDTKRGEDARARLYALSEAPEIWGSAVERWRALHVSHVKQLDDGPAPEPETEWLLYQALAGVWPADLSPDNSATLGELSKRFAGYVEKALREAKLRTAWTEPNEPYEAAVNDYASRMLSPDNRAFLDDFSTTLQPFIRVGAQNTLAQTLIKMTAPGIPDIYQGTEISDLSLVDPDNRRAVDFEMLATRLGRSREPYFSEISILDGTAKQRLIMDCLKFRASHHDLFARGSYVPLQVSGARSSNLVAFMRVLGDDFAIVAVPRLIFPLCRHALRWDDPEFWLGAHVGMPAGCEDRACYRFFTGERFKIADRLLAADLFATSPVTMLVSQKRS
jgi:(1->4)-alpha-D-glucan 1-alpha-D-glucosylmutase